MHNARRPGGLSPPTLEDPEYEVVVRLNLRHEDAQHQAALRCQCHGICVVVAGDLTGLPTSVEFLGILPFTPI